MRRIITWSDARQTPVDRHRDLGAHRRRTLDGPEAAERDEQRRLQVAAGKRREQARRRPAAALVPRRQGHARHRRLQLHGAARGRRQGRDNRRQAWLASGAEPVNSARVEFSPDGKGALLFASLNGNPGEAPFRASVEAIRAHFGDRIGAMQVRVTGPGGLITDVYEIFLNADIKLLVGTVILVLVLLLLIYRSPVLPFVPLLAVGFGYFVAGGILALGAKAARATLSGQATSLMVILLFGAGTDYGLLLISRYREELRRETDHRVALATALGETWEAIAASGMTVTLAVLTLLFARYGEYVAFAPVLGVGVFVTLIAGLTLMPALLAVLGRRAFWPRVPRTGDATRHRTWQRVAETVAAGPRRGGGVVAVCSWCWAWSVSSTAPDSASPRTS